MDSNSQLTAALFLVKTAEDNKSFAGQHPILSSLGLQGAGAAGASLLSSIYGSSGIFNGAAPDTSKGQAQSKVKDVLEKLMRKNNFSPRSYFPGSMNPVAPRHSRMELPHAGRRGVAYLSPKGHPAVHAHEFGHMKAPNNLLSGGKIMHGLGSLAGFTSLFRTDKETAKRDAIAGSALSAAGLMPAEIDASARGFGAMGRINKMKGMPHMGLGSRLKTFAGLPSYALMSALPYLVYKMRESAGVFDNK